MLPFFLFVKMDMHIEHPRFFYSTDCFPPIFDNIGINIEWTFACSMALPLNGYTLCVFDLKWNWKNINTNTLIFQLNIFFDVKFF